MASKRITLRDVAEASGVSRATVSFVLNASPNQTISRATRDRVRQVASDLGYVPHGIARALREGSSRIVVLTISRGLETNYTRSYIRGLDDELGEHDHVLLVRYGQASAESTKRVLDLLSPRAVLRFAENYLDGHELDDGGWQNGMAANTATQIGHLADRGHTRLAMVLPGEGDPLADVRTRFAREAARRLGLPRPVTFAVPRERAAARRAVERFTGTHRSVTAVACFNDEVALRVLTALHDHGRTAPDDLAVIGFDETDYSALSTPSLTTIHIDAETHGRLAARSVLGLDTAGLEWPPGRVVVRDST